MINFMKLTNLINRQLISRMMRDNRYSGPANLPGYAKKMTRAQAFSCFFATPVKLAEPLYMLFNDRVQVEA